MGFSPLHFFRKRQRLRKLFMAGLVLIAMITFIGVVGSGQNVGTGWAMRIKGLFGVVDHAVGIVGGQGYDYQHLYPIFFQRQRAAGFIDGIVEQGRERILLDDLGFTKEDLSSKERFVTKRDEVLKKDRNALQPLEMPPASLAYDAVQTYLQQRQTLAYIRQVGYDPAKLGIEDPLAPEQLLEFVYWLKKADELGIVMSSDRVKEEVIRAGYSRIKDEHIVASAMKLGVDSETMLRYVADEIRVMLAKAVVLAPDRFTGNMLSAQVTPLDLWKAYVEIKTQLTVGVLPIQVNSKEFLDRVAVPEPGSAKWQEFVDTKLKPYFDEHKKQQPDPQRDTPGFMIPKKYQIEFLYGDLRGTTDTRKYYEQMALVQDSLPVVAQALGMTGLPLPTMEANRVVETYKINKLSGRYHLPDDPQSVLMAGTELADGSRYQLTLPAGPGPFNTGPGVERQAAGQAVLNLASMAAQPLSPLGVAAALRPMPRKTARLMPQPQSLEVAAAVASAGQNLGAALFQPALIGFYARLDYSEETQPFNEVLASIRDEVIEDQCRTLLTRDLQQLKKELDEYGKKYRVAFDEWKRLKAGADARNVAAPPFNPPPFVRKEGDKEIKEPVQDYLKRYAAARGLTYEGMKEPRGQYELFNEKDSTPLGSILRPVYVKSLPDASQKPDDEIRRSLIGGKGLFDAAIIQSPRTTGFGIKPWEYAIHWKVVETDAREPKFAEVENQVLEAWKLKEARTFAEEQANALAKQARTEDGERVLKDNPSYLPEKFLGRYESAGPFNYRKSNITYVDSPPDDLVDQALTRLKNPGDTLIVTNKPKSTYYLLVLKKRDEPKATNRESVSKFDFDVMIPDRALQIQIDGVGISHWAQREKVQEFQKSWQKYFRERTEYDEKEAARVTDSLRSAARE